MIKYYALDELFGLIGGNLSLLILGAGYLIQPYSIITFVADNSSKKEEIEMHIGQAVDGNDSETIKLFEDAIDLRNEFLQHKTAIYLQFFLPQCFFNTH